MADTAQSPAQPSNAAAPGGDQAAPPSAEDLQKQLAAKEQELATLGERYSQLQSTLGRQGAELGVLRRRTVEATAVRTAGGRGAIDYSHDPVTDEGDPAGGNGGGDPAPPPRDPNAARIDVIQFRQDHPDLTKEDYAEVMLLLNDDSRYREFLVRDDRNGGVDLYHTMKNALREVKSTKLEKLLATRNANERQHEQERGAAISRGVISTSDTTAGATAGRKTYTIEEVRKMTPKQMVDAGLVDPADAF